MAAILFFEEGLKSAFSIFREHHNKLFPLTLYYAFKQSEIDSDSLSNTISITSSGWETMLEGLIISNFIITGHGLSELNYPTECEVLPVMPWPLQSLSLAGQDLKTLHRPREGNLFQLLKKNCQWHKEIYPSFQFSKCKEG